MELIAEAFAPYAPREAQFHMPVEEWVERFAPVKPLFIHHARTRGIMEGLVAELGCDPDDTYLDVPRLRGVTSDGYLTSGVGLRAPPAPRHVVRRRRCARSTGGFRCTSSSPRRAWRFTTSTSREAIRNGSAEFDYYEWNAVGRKDAAKHITSDSRRQPKPEEPLDLDDRVALPARARGHRRVLRRAAALDGAEHVGARAVQHRLPHGQPRRRARGPGAPNVDSCSTGTSLRDFAASSDGARFTDARGRSRTSGAASAPKECCSSRPTAASAPMAADTASRSAPEPGASVPRWALWILSVDPTRPPDGQLTYSLALIDAVVAGGRRRHRGASRTALARVDVDARATRRP